MLDQITQNWLRWSTLGTATKVRDQKLDVYGELGDFYCIQASPNQCILTPRTVQEHKTTCDKYSHPVSPRYSCFWAEKQFTPWLHDADASYYYNLGAPVNRGAELLFRCHQSAGQYVTAWTYLLTATYIRRSQYYNTHDYAANVLQSLNDECKQFDIIKSFDNASTHQRKIIPDTAAFYDKTLVPWAIQNEDSLSYFLFCEKNYLLARYRIVVQFFMNE